MKKRDAIIISVLVNAGLIAVLLIAALTNKGDKKEPVAQAEVEKIDLTAQAFETAQTTVVENEFAKEGEAAVWDGNAIPSSEGNVTHKLPETVAADAAQQATPLVEAASVESQPSFTEVKVRRGDSLEKIARSHHTTIAKIREINGLKGNMLRIGQVLRIDAAGSSAQRTSSGLDEYYTVKVGDNPWTIAMKHHMRVSDLMKLNNLTSERAKKLKPGDKLRVR